MTLSREKANSVTSHPEFYSLKEDFNQTQFGKYQCVAPYPTPVLPPEGQNKIWFLLRVDGLVLKCGPSTVRHLPIDMCKRVALSEAVGSRPGPTDLIHTDSWIHEDRGRLPVPARCGWWPSLV